ncbi:hypothetical protein NC652_015181 [Populus alba x Populus x berolinensis]|nr:hypothetical protein NC652_015181 [Populus alba x Populus x berolinensis]
MPQLVIASVNDRATLSFENEENTFPSKFHNPNTTQITNTMLKRMQLSPLTLAKSTSNGSRVVEGCSFPSAQSKEARLALVDAGHI